MPTATLIKRGGSSSSSQTSLVVELVASSSGIGSHSREFDNCYGTKDASISVAKSPRKKNIQRLKEKIVAKKSQPGVKPTIMKKKKRCSSMGCTNQAYKGGVCTTHGAIKKHKLCSHVGCTKQAVKGGVCVTHGAIKKPKRCSFNGCTNQVKKGGVCVTHGAKLKRCRSRGAPMEPSREEFVSPMEQR
jgi:hypothetical protein